MKNFGLFMTIVLALIIIPIINGFVVMKLWAWFIVPTFQMNPLRIVESIGIMYLISFIRKKRDKYHGDNFRAEFISIIVFEVLVSALTLFSGWIVQMFM